MFEGRPTLWLWLIIIAIGTLAGTLTRVLRWNRERRGWWIEVLGPAQLRGDADEIAVVYHEGERSLWLKGYEGPRGVRARLQVPDAQAWNAAVEAWAHERRDEIMERVRADHHVRRQVEAFE